MPLPPAHFKEFVPNLCLHILTRLRIDIEVSIEQVFDVVEEDSDNTSVLNHRVSAVIPNPRAPSLRSSDLSVSPSSSPRSITLHTTDPVPHGVLPDTDENHHTLITIHIFNVNIRYFHFFNNSVWGLSLDLHNSCNRLDAGAAVFNQHTGHGIVLAIVKLHVDGAFVQIKFETQLSPTLFLVNISNIQLNRWGHLQWKLIHPLRPFIQYSSISWPRFPVVSGLIRRHNLEDLNALELSNTESEEELETPTNEEE
ncbi:hypothetical protein C8J56DRAFT_887966 [Mycena floridula]|nr:hypothetical protein C8J56DRAFT_887966 [Mycena floridula]